MEFEYLFPTSCTEKTKLTASEFIIDFLIGLLILGNPIVSLVMVFLATLTETEVNKIDDNLIVPVFASFFGQITLTFLRVYNNFSKSLSQSKL